MTLKESLEALYEHFKEREKMQEFICYLCEDSYAIFSVGGKLIDAYVSVLEEKHNLKDWISWFVFECDFGKRPMEAYMNGIEYKIDSIESFCELAELLSHSE